MTKIMDNGLPPRPARAASFEFKESDKNLRAAAQEIVAGMSNLLDVIAGHGCNKNIKAEPPAHIDNKPTSDSLHLFQEIMRGRRLTIY